jgi:hypothetical protein
MRTSKWLGLSVLSLTITMGVGCKQGATDDGSGGGEADTGASTTDASSSDATGSGGGDGGAGSGTGGGETGGGDAGGGSAVSSGGTGGGSPAGWTAKYHPCPGSSRTDALLVEDDGTIWVGCGTTAVGYGLFASHDDGDSWELTTTSPETMAQFRVSGILRGDDGLLYVAGFDANDSDMILALDTSGGLPAPVSDVLYAGNQVGTSFHVGSFALLSDGRIWAESLTGVGSLFREDDGVGPAGTQWEDTYYWANEGSPPGYQMSDIIAVDDKLYGCGATIAEPPYLFLPPRGAGQEPYELEVIEMPNDGWTGEMWGVAATDDRVVVVGVDQDNDVGKIYVSGADPYEASDYSEIDLTSIVGDSDLGTWARGVCMRGDKVVVVGERQPLSSDTGLVLLSEDGGASFTDITPVDDVGETVSKCTILESGAVIVAGASGFVGRYD